MQAALSKQHNYTLAASTFLDIRLTNIAFCDTWNVETIKLWLISEMQALGSCDGQTTNRELCYCIKCLYWNSLFSDVRFTRWKHWKEWCRLFNKGRIMAGIWHTCNGFSGQSHNKHGRIHWNAQIYGRKGWLQGLRTLYVRGKRRAHFQRWAKWHKDTLELLQPLFQQRGCSQRQERQ